MRESEKHVNYASKARNLHVGARRQKDAFFEILVVVSCERMRESEKHLISLKLTHFDLILLTRQSKKRVVSIRSAT